MKLNFGNVLSAAVFSLLTLTACQKEGSFERAGDRVDEIGDNIKEGENPLKKKGPMEQAGEAVDEAVTGD